MPSKKSKKKDQLPEGACPFCWTVHPSEWFVPPEIPEDPDIILIGEAPGKEEIKYGKPFIGPAGGVLRDILLQVGVKRPLIINSSNCFAKDKPTTATINRTHETFLLPILSNYPTLPVVALGAYAAQLVVGGKHGETSLAGEVRETLGHLCHFTYHPAYFLYEQDSRIKDEIASTIRTALREYRKPKYIQHILPKDVEEIVIDVETSTAAYPWYNSKLLMVGIMPTGKPPYIIKSEELTDAYKDFLARNVRRVIGHNLIYDLVHLAHAGIRFPLATYHDTLIYQKNLHPNEWSYGLKDLARRYTGIPAWQGWFHQQIAEQKNLEEIEWTKFAEYNAYDLYATEALYLQQQKKYMPFQLEMDYMQYVLKMTLNGMYVDVQKLDDLGRRTADELINVESKIRETYNLGKDFNFRSPAQLIAWFDMLGIELPDTKEETLNLYKGDHPVLADLLQMRNLNKLKGTSVDGLKVYIDSESLVHSTVLVHGAETGRSSSSAPNVQNTDPRVRGSFVSRFPDGRLLYTDLSALEYRLIAHAAREGKLIQAFKSNADIHLLAYEYIFGKVAKDKAERKLGKTCNYAGVYGCGLGKFVTLTELDEDVASKAFSKLGSLYPFVGEWKDNIIYDLKRTGRVANLFGRIREFSGRISQDAEREAINWIIQSSGHDILKIYLMESADALEQLEPRPLLINETHDSFTVDCQKEVAEEAYTIVQNVSNSLNKLIEEIFGVTMRVPITSEVKLLEVWE